MVTNNFKKILFGGILRSTSNSSGIPTFNAISLVDKDGNSIDITNMAYGNIGFDQNSMLNAFNHIASSESNGVITIKAGNGTTQPTSNDYTLESETTDIICSNTSTGLTQSITKTYTATFNNPTQHDINITELGLFLTNNSTKTFLLDRTVLSTPITIPAGQSKSITYEIAF